ncbi:MAG: type I-F CRISPR-associated protein Csy2 [Zoogloeaceae bacterium]|jgi:CRISPR-associated protein Csy2|nr:type I-F CRISPR-associated protein Csy2 [Zoogloeaceae bacterium]
MAKCPHFEHLLIVPRLRVQNANAISSPLTHGFPAMSAFLGLMWALERRTTAQGLDVLFNAVGVVCHDYQEQVAEDTFAKAFCLTRNPSLDKSKIGSDGKIKKPDAIVEEGRIHLDLSLVFAVQSRTLSEHMALGQTDAANAVAAKVNEHILTMRIAGGSVVHLPDSRAQKADIVSLIGTEADQQKAFNRAKLRLLPGFTLVSRDDLLEARHAEMRAQDPDASRLDAWLSLSRVNWRCVTSPDKKLEWKRDNPGGWLRPIPVGYGTLSGPHDPGAVANARDAKTPFCFVESLYSIGEWLSPHRLNSPQDLLWYADHVPDAGLYRCRNDYRLMPGR